MRWWWGRICLRWEQRGRHRIPLLLGVIARSFNASVNERAPKEEDLFFVWWWRGRGWKMGWPLACSLRLWFTQTHSVRWWGQNMEDLLLPVILFLYLLLLSEEVLKLCWEKVWFTLQTRWQLKKATFKNHNYYDVTAIWTWLVTFTYQHLFSFGLVSVNLANHNNIFIKNILYVFFISRTRYITL